MKPGYVWRKKARKFFSDPSVYALLLVFVFGYVVYQGCVFDTSGIGAGTPLGVTPPPDGCSGQYYFYDVNSYFGVYGFSPFPQYQLSSGSLPQGLGLDTSTGIISGTPTVFGIGEFDIQVQAIGAAQEVLATGDFRIRIHDFSITTAQLPPVCDGTLYSAAIEICGGVPPFTWETVDWDPAVLPLNFVDPGPSNTRQNTLTGTPVNAGDYRFTVRVTDSRGDAFRVDKEFEIEVMDGLTILTPRNLPVRVVGVAFSQVLEACGGTTPYTWNEVNTTIDPWPAFLSLDPSSGTLSGTPAVAGAYLLKVRLSDQGGSSTEKSFTLTVAASLLTVPQYSVTCVECLPNPGCTQDLSVMLSGGLGIPVFQLAAGSVLPPNLTLSSEGILSGTGMVPGNFNFDVVVFDGTTDPLNPPRNTVTVNVQEYPAQNSIVTIVRARHGAFPYVAGEPPFDEIDLLFTENVKIDFTINDPNWRDIWDNENPGRAATLSLEGYCGSISPLDFRSNPAGFYVIVYDLSAFSTMVGNTNDGTDDVYFTIVLELYNGETATRARIRHAITVVNQP